MIGKYIRVTGKRYKGTIFKDCIAEVTDFIPNADIVTVKIIKMKNKDLPVKVEDMKEGRIQFNYSDVDIITDKEAVLEAL